MQSKLVIGSLLVDFDRQVVEGDRGEIRVEPKLLQLLRLLAERQGEVVARGTLLDTVWQDVYGSEQSLTNAISQLRKLWSENGTEKMVIETVPKRGYRLVARVRSPAPRRRWIAAAGLTAAFAIAAIWFVHQASQQSAPPVSTQVHEPAASGRAKPVLAIAPIDTDQDLAPIASGLVEEVVDLLATRDELLVITSFSAAGVAAMGNSDATILELLEASHLLKGKLRTADDGGLILDLKLVAADLGEVWDRRLEVSRPELPRLESRVANAVLGELAGERLAIRGSVMPSDSYELYLRAVVKQRANSSDSLLQAHVLLEDAIRRSPAFAQAHARLAQIYLALGAEAGGVTTYAPEDARRLARPHLETALELDPFAIDSLEAKWRMELAENDCRAAERTLRSALQHIPSSAAAHYGLYEARACQGKWSEAFEAAEQAARLDPFDDQFAMDYAATLVLLNRFNDALAVWQRIVRLHPERATGYRGLGHYNRFSGRLADAQRWYDKALTIDPELLWNRLYGARNLLDMGLFERSLELLPEADRWEYFMAVGQYASARDWLLDTNGDLRFPGQVDALAEACSKLGEKETARSLLEELAAQTEGTVGPLFGEFPELDIAAPHLVLLRRQLGDEDGSRELAARVRTFLDDYREQGGDDYLLDILEARLAAAEGELDDAIRWFQKAIDRGYRIRRLASFPEFEALEATSSFIDQLALMERLAQNEAKTYLANPRLADDAASAAE